MATEPRQIAGMVESAMGAGGSPMPEDEALDIELEEDTHVY